MLRRAARKRDHWFKNSVAGRDFKDSHDITYTSSPFPAR
jgi:hypothetical protein